MFGDKSAETYQGVAAFFDYLRQTEVQEYLHQTSGYLPVTMAAYEATKASGFYDKNPGREQPITQMMGKPPTENSKGVRLVNLPQVRDIQNEEFEKMLAGEQTAQRRSTTRSRAPTRRSRRRSASERRRGCAASPRRPGVGPGAPWPAAGRLGC